MQRLAFAVVVTMMVLSQLPLAAASSQVDGWSEVHDVQVERWAEEFTADDAAAVKAETIEQAGFYVDTVATRYKNCWRVTHGVTYKKAGISQYKTTVRKQWCSSNSLYPIVLGPFTVEWWYEVMSGNWSLSNSAVSVNSWYYQDYVHQTLMTFTFKQSFAGQSSYRTSTNSVCGMTLGHYTTTNDCSGEYKNAVKTGTYTY